MAGAAEDALLDDPIRADLEHVEIVIRFREPGNRRRGDWTFDKLRHVARSVTIACFAPVRRKVKSDGISRVVRNGERWTQCADCEVLGQAGWFRRV